MSSVNKEQIKDAGVAGMVLTMLALGAEHLLAAVDMKAPAGQNLVLFPESGVNANPHLAAKVLWAQSIKDLRMITSMALANVMCQRIALSLPWPDSTIVTTLKNSIRAMAAENCGLEPDEADSLFNSSRSYVERIFSHPHVKANIVPFSQFLRAKGLSEKQEIIEYLASAGLAQ